MYCYKCGKANKINSNFCYNCGTKLIKKEIYCTKNLLNKDILKEIKNLDFIKKLMYNNLIISKNRYRNLFFISAFFTLTICFGFSLLFGLNASLDSLKFLINQPHNSATKILLKNQTELMFRDIWIRAILSIICFCASATCVLVVFSLKRFKSKKIYHK